MSLNTSLQFLITPSYIYIPKTSNSKQILEIYSNR